MFVRHRGKTKLMHFKKTDTTANSSLKEGSLVKISDSGNLQYCKNDSDDRVVGVCRQTIAAADTSSWNNAPLVPVEVPVENSVEWLIDTDSDAGAVDSDIGRYCAVDTAQASDSEATRVDISDTAQRTVLITGIVSASKIIGVIVKSAFAPMRQLQGDTTSANIT